MSKLCVVNHIADYVLSNSESGSIRSHKSATGNITFTLPSSPSEGIYFYFFGMEGGASITIALGNGSHRINDNSNPVAGQSIWTGILSTGGNTESIMLVYNGSGEWLTTEKYGVWQPVT